MVSVTASAETKICTACKQELPVSEFSRKLSSYDHRCRPCKATYAREWRLRHRDRLNAEARAWHAANREVANAGRKERHRLNPQQKKAHDLMKMYGLTLEQYDEMLARQNHACAICGEPESRTRKGKLLALVVDHDHETGDVRGLLCASCNSVLGLADDDPDRLRAAAAYIEEAH